MGDAGAKCPRLCLGTPGVLVKLGGLLPLRVGQSPNPAGPGAQPQFNQCRGGEEPASPNGGLEAGLSEGSVLGDPPNGGHTGPCSPQGTLFPWARCCGDAPGLAAPNVTPRHLWGQGHPRKQGQEPPRPHIHIPFALPGSPSPAQHPAPPQQHPAPCPPLGAPLCFLLSCGFGWGVGGFGCRGAAHRPPRHPARPALPLPTTPSTQHRPDCRAPLAPWHQRDFSPTTFSLFLSLSPFSLWFLFFFFFFFLIPSVFFFSLPFEKNPNGNIHFHFLLSRSRDEGEGRAMKRAFFPRPLVLVSFLMISFLFPCDVQKCKRYISLLFPPSPSSSCCSRIFCFCVC